jgi:hypothetical protein
MLSLPAFPSGKIRDALSWLAVIYGCALVGTVFAPGLIADHDRVFFDKDLREKASVRVRLAEYDRTTATLRSQLLLIDNQIAALVRQPSMVLQLESALRSRERVAQRLEATHQPIVLIPFFMNPQMFLWPIIYGAFGALLLVFGNGRHACGFLKKHLVQIGATSATVYILYQWPLWMRNAFFLNISERKVFAYCNRDIDLSSFIAQEVTIFGFCFLVAWFICVETASTDAVRQELLDDNRQGWNYVVARPVVDQLATDYWLWLARSVTLASGFIFFTNFYWHLVVMNNDARYLPSAINAHVLWGFCWVLISLPLIARWRRWDMEKLLTRLQLAQNGLGQPDSAKTLAEIEPGASGRLAISMALAVAAFIAPIAREFLH